MTVVIDSFTGEYAWLSNFDTTPFMSGGSTVRSVEHMYQACKAVSRSDQEVILAASTPGLAKKLGRKVKLVDNWEEVKDSTMLACLILKFSQNQHLAQKLVDTGDAMLIEGNWWGDKYWGVCKGEGKNMLGYMLMGLRDEIKSHGVEAWCNSMKVLANVSQT